MSKENSPSAQITNKEGRERDGVAIVRIQMEHLPAVHQILIEAFASKRFLFCFSGDESLGALRRRYQEMPKDKLKLGAVAVDEESRVVGYIQLTTKGLPMYPPGSHSCRRDEYYVEQIAVSSIARGKGIGTKLLNWSEQTALENPSIGFLQLGVLRGNPAIHLYERFGFKVVEVDCVDECCATVFITCLLGRPYGCCNEKWGGVDMVKRLER